MSRVVVFGSINADLMVRVPVVPRAGETLLGRTVTHLHGGKGANQAVAAARMGADVAMIGAVGQDDTGQRQLANLAANGIDVSAVTREPSPTGLAVVTVTDTGENSIIVVAGANRCVGGDHVEAMLRNVLPGDLLLAQLELPSAVVAEALHSARAKGARTVLNAAPMTELDGLLGAVDILVVNETEAESLSLRRHLDTDVNDPTRTAQRLAHELEVRLVMTLGARGSVMAEPSGRLTQVQGRKVAAVDTTGAGDTFVGAFCATVAAGRDQTKALQLANHAAAVACTAAGAQTAMPRMSDISEPPPAHRGS